MPGKGPEFSEHPDGGSVIAYQMGNRCARYFKFKEHALMGPEFQLLYSPRCPANVSQWQSYSSDIPAILQRAIYYVRRSQLFSNFIFAAPTERGSALVYSMIDPYSVMN
jgi:hypothetical protein